MFRTLFIGAVLCCLVGCNAYTVQKLPYDAALQTIVIERNDKVLVSDFEETLKYILRDLGLKVRVAQHPYYSYDPSTYVLHYTARQSWDFTAYLSLAEVTLYKNNQKVAKGTYKHRGASCSLSPFKWQGTESKIRPLLEELFEEYQGRRP